MLQEQLLQLIAKEGNTQAQCSLCQCYESGTGVEKNEQELYQKAVEQANAQAQCNLGWCYESGTVVEKDKQRAVELYQKAVEQGNAQAQFNFGWYCYGRMVWDLGERLIFRIVVFFRPGAITRLASCYRP